MSSDRFGAPGTVRPGGRTARTRDAVLAAALEELNEFGYGGLSTARIADRAGVHRTTVHRRWPDRSELIAEALIDDAALDIPMPDEGNVRADLRVLLGAIAAHIDTEQARQRIRALVSESARSQTITSVVTRAWTTRFEIGEEVIRRGIARGEIRDGIAPMTIFATFVAPLYLRLLITDERLDEQFIDEVVAIALDGAGRPPSVVTRQRSR